MKRRFSTQDLIAVLYLKKLLFTVIPLCLLTFSITAQQVAPLWTDFVNAKRNGTEPVLPDFSYAGYHFSEIPIPDVSGRTYFNVTDYGALPNDTLYDDAGIQAAIKAAEANPNGGVVYFPAGRYIISPDEDATKYIRISKSNIVLKGAGTGAGGTEIFQDKMRIATRQFQFRPTSSSQPKITTITQRVPRETFWVDVASTANLTVGKTVVIKHKSESFTRHYFDPLVLKPEWERLFGANGGMQIAEIHTIEKIEGNRVKFLNPVHLNIDLVSPETFDICAYSGIREVGIEDILFTSNWKNYPETFVHHKDGIHDGGWCAVTMEYVEDSWIRNCEFRDINEAVFMRAGYRVSVINTHFTGKKGHSSVHARSGNGVLVKHCNFNGAHHHGPGGGYNGVGFVTTQCTMTQGQSIDSHGGVPYASLYDDLDGGVVTGLGGPIEGHPHHGRDFVGWNWIYKASGNQTVNFWNMAKRENNTMAYPNFIGLQPNRTITFINAGRDEQRGIPVLPKSLFEAQLQYRLEGLTGTFVAITAPAAKTIIDGGALTTISADAIAPGDSIVKVEFFANGIKIGEDTSAPFSIQWEAQEGAPQLIAKAIDTKQHEGLSSPVTITVNPLGLKVAITAPVNAASFTAPATIAIEAAATDSLHTISKVEFFQGSTKIGEDTESPWKFNWNNVAKGNYVLQAKATNDIGKTGISLPVNITVTAPVIASFDITDNGGIISGQYPNTSKPTENFPSLIDNSKSTKYYRSGRTALWVQYQSTVPAIVVRYTIASANDVPGRDPKDWSLQGSNNGSSWTTIDTRTNETFASRLLTKSYTAANTTPWLYYRLSIAGNNGETGTQLSEWELFERRTQTIAFDSLEDKIYGDDPIELSATAGSGLPVAFELVSGPATLTDSLLSITGTGVITIRARQAGNANYFPADSVDRSFTVHKSNQEILFDAVEPRTFGDPPVELTASSNAGLPVSFEVVAGRGTISDSILTITGAGNITIRAYQAGNENYEPAAVEQILVVNKATQTISFGAIPPSIKYQSLRLSATSSTGLAVAFSIVAGQAALNGDSLKLTHEGLVTIQADQPGNDNYEAAPAVQQTILVFGLDYLKDGIKIKVYPNPTRGPLKVKVENGKDRDYSFIVFDSRGNIVASTVIPRSRKVFEINFDISASQNGIYFLHVSDGVDKSVRMIIKY